MVKPYDERSQQEINDLEYYMKQLNPNFGIVEKEEQNRVFQEVCKCMNIECFKSGEIIYVHGSQADKYYLVLEGEIGAYLPGQDDKLVLVNQVKIKESFGQKSLSFNKPRFRTMIAQKDSICGVLNAKDFQKILKNHFSLLESEQINFLWELPYLKMLDFKQVKMLHSACSIEKFSHHQYVYKEEVDNADCFYIIKSGSFVIHKKIRPHQLDQELNQSEKSPQLANTISQSVSKKLCILDEREQFGLDDIISNNPKRKYSVQCHSKEAEVVVISHNLFHLIIMSNPSSAKIIKKQNKQFNKNLETIISNRLIKCSNDSQQSTPNLAPLDGSSSPNRTQLAPTNISQLQIQQMDRETVPQIQGGKNILNHQIVLEKNNITIDSQQSSQGEDNSILSKQNQIHTLSPISRINRPKLLTIQPYSLYGKNNTLEPVKIQDDRRKSYTPNQVTKDLIDSLYKANKQQSNNEGQSLSQMSSSFLASPKNKLNINNIKERIKSTTNLGINNNKFLRSESSLSDFDNDQFIINKRLSENCQSSQTNQTNLSDSKDENLEEILPRTSSFALQIRQGSNSLNSQPNQIAINDQSQGIQKKKSYIFNHLQSLKRESLEEIASDDDEQQLEQIKQSQTKFITLSIPQSPKLQNQQQQADISSFNQSNGKVITLNVYEKQQSQEVKNQEKNNQFNSEINDTTLKHFEEEEQIYQTLKDSVNKKNTFVSCYSYLPSISTFFLKKQENPIDQITEQRKYTPPNRINKLDLQAHQMNRKLKQLLNKSALEDIHSVDTSPKKLEMSYQERNLERNKVINNTLDFNKTNFPGTTSSLASQTNTKTPQPYQTFYYHNPRKFNNDTSQSNLSTKGNINRSSLKLSYSQQNSQNVLSQNNFQSQYSLDKRSHNNQPISTSQDSVGRNTPTIYQQTQKTEIDIQYAKKMEKPKFLLGEKPKKEVIGVFNPDFFTSLKGKFIKQFTYNPQIFKDIQRYKFEDFLRRHLHEGPLCDYLEKKGSVESNAQKKKDQEDFKRSKNLVDQIATNAIESNKQFHRQQMRRSQGFEPQSFDNNKGNFFPRSSKLNSLNVSQTNLHSNQYQSPQKKPINGLNQNRSDQQHQQIQFVNKQPNRLAHRHSQSQDFLQQNVFQKQMNNYQTQYSNQINTVNSRKKKKQPNFILSTSGLQDQKMPIRLHSMNNNMNSTKQLNLSQA